MGAIFMVTRIVNRGWIGGVKVTLNLNLPCYGEVKQLRLKTSVTTYEKMKILNVAEKNDAAKSIANVMSRGASQRREGFSQYNKIYQFDYMLHGRQVTMNMTSVSGHLQDLDFAGQYKSWKSCSPLTLFDAPVVKFVPEKFQPIKRTLEREARGAKKLIIWTDCDREGENIGFEVIDVVRSVNPGIEVLRAKFSEITNNSISRAVATLQPPDALQNDAVEVRRELDLRIGAAFTRFLTTRYQVAFPELAELIISYGSCQFPTLGFVVERYKQIQEFVAEPFWKLKVVLEEDTKQVDFSWKRVRLFDYDAVRGMYELCIEQPMATVTDVKKKSKSKWRPVALDTVEFEKTMCRKLRMSAKRAMQIAEKLYTSGFISYPRTETNQFPKDFNLRELVQNQTHDGNWGEFAEGLLHSGITPRNGKKSDQAHPPIHPTKYTNTLNGEEAKVYEFIVRHFLACCSQDAKGFETTVEIDIANEKFTASGLVILERNYLDVYPYERWADKDIPDFDQGDCYQPKSIEIQSGETSPPNLLTEADLIALMEKHGIGTDATHAEHIEKIQERSYAGVQDNKFLPGKLGMGLVEGYDALGFEFSKPYLRAGLENDLKLICEGRKQKDDVLRDQIRTYREKFEISMSRVGEIDNEMKRYLDAQMNDPGPLNQQQGPPQPAVRKCPNCGSDMTLRQRSNSTGDQQTQPTQTQGQPKRPSYYIGCMGYPECRSAMWLPREMIDVKVLDRTCQRCGPDTRLMDISFKPGSVPPFIDQQYTGCIMCDSNMQDAFNLTIKTSKNNQNNQQNNRSANQTTNRGRGNNSAPGNMSNNNSSRKQRNTGNNTTTVGQSRMNGSNAHPAGEDNVPVCECGKPAAQLTVRKEGPNQGRPFYKCDGGGCNFFTWADQPQSREPRQFTGGGDRNTPQRGGSNHTPQRRGPNHTPNRGLHSTTQGDRQPLGAMDNQLMCECGQPSVLLTVRKDGPNQGRQFHKCDGGKCKFFTWADEAGNTTQQGSTVRDGQRAAPQPSFSGQNPVDDGNTVQCPCNQLAKRLTVQKDGPNKGREFFACQKPRDQSCGFFQWADQDQNEPPRGSNRGGYRGGTQANRGGYRGGGSTGGGTKRKCGHCREEGHTKKKCPQL